MIFLTVRVIHFLARSYEDLRCCEECAETLLTPPDPEFGLPNEIVLVFGPVDEGNMDPDHCQVCAEIQRREDNYG